ncbi:MAG: sulfatase-like hydrolase/transferase, partial [Alphaproteobacteria bacterium]|nr:sulfatase-like hydrolase/transferase [Alphaproteobacteria bacterium]
ASIIEKLKAYPQYQSAMLYISDHGESLGENNIYLHGLPYKIAPDYQNQVPMILWLSDKMAKSNKINIDILRQKAEIGEYSHDNFFHTLIGLSDIKTTVYKRDMDLIDM